MPEATAPVSRPRRTVVVLGAAVVSGVAGYVVLVLTARFLDAAENADFLVFWGAMFGVFGVLIGISSETTRAVFAGRESAAAGVRVVPISAALGVGSVVVLGLTGLWWGPHLFGPRWQTLLPVLLLGVALFAVHCGLGGGGRRACRVGSVRRPGRRRAHRAGACGRVGGDGRRQRRWLRRGDRGRRRDVAALRPGLPSLPECLARPCGRGDRAVPGPGARGELCVGRVGADPRGVSGPAAGDHLGRRVLDRGPPDPGRVAVAGAPAGPARRLPDHRGDQGDDRWRACSHRAGARGGGRDRASVFSSPTRSGRPCSASSIPTTRWRARRSAAVLPPQAWSPCSRSAGRSASPRTATRRTSPAGSPPPA